MPCMSESANTKIITVAITLMGETRDVEFRLIGHGLWESVEPQFAARIGNGAKLHRTYMNAWLKDTGEFKPTSAVCILNRQARIVCWSHQAGENIRSKASTTHF